jgi:hypothetical protein
LLRQPVGFFVLDVKAHSTNSTRLIYHSTILPFYHFPVARFALGSFREDVLVLPIADRDVVNASGQGAKEFSQSQQNGGKRSESHSPYGK